MKMPTMVCVTPDLPGIRGEVPLGFSLGGTFPSQNLSSNKGAARKRLTGRGTYEG